MNDEIVISKSTLYKASAAILAGGKSSRTECDKTMLPIDNRPMIGHIFKQLKPHFQEIFISANDREKYSFLGANIVPDAEAGQGPLMGIACSLQAARNSKVFVVACDIPDININLVRRLLDEAAHFDCVIPVLDSEKFEPLFAVYRKEIYKEIRQLLLEDERKVAALFPRVRTRYIKIGNAEWYSNLNTFDDYRKYLNNTNKVRNKPGA